MLTVSIITPTRNEAGALQLNCRSIDSQTYPAVEHLVIDGSDPGHVATGYGKHRVIYAEPHGVYEAMNCGLLHAGGDIIGVLNGNDRLAAPPVISRVAEVFDSHPDVDFVYGDVVITSADGKVCRRYRADNFSTRLLRHGFAPPHPSLYIRREAMERAGLYDCRFTTAADFDMWLRLFIDLNLRGLYLPMVFASMSGGGLSASWRNRLWRNPVDRLHCLRKHGIKATPLSLLPRYFRLIKELLS